MRITIKSDLQFAEGCRLNLVSILELLNPFSFLTLEAVNLTLDSHTLLIFFVDTADKLSALLLAFHLLTHITGFESLFFLVAYHLLH